MFGNYPAFPITHEYGYTVLREVLLFPLLGVLCGIVSALFVRTYFATGALLQALMDRRPDSQPQRRGSPALWSVPRSLLLTDCASVPGTSPLP